MALKFYASIRMDSRKIESLKDGDRVIGSRHRVRIVKNKVSPPFRVAEFDVMQDGISKEGGLIDVGLELNILTNPARSLNTGRRCWDRGGSGKIIPERERQAHEGDYGRHLESRQDRSSSPESCHGGGRGGITIRHIQDSIFQ